MTSGTEPGKPKGQFTRDPSDKRVLNNIQKDTGRSKPFKTRSGEDELRARPRRRIPRNVEGTGEKEEVLSIRPLMAGRDRTHGLDKAG
ncbi:hypothetical protein TNCV_4994931 [Trichonephila clavipes]|nr:hypothetical protein TNCV_4994931 [Trichonephila clavipes]